MFAVPSCCPLRYANAPDLPTGVVPPEPDRVAEPISDADDVSCCDPLATSDALADRTADVLSCCEPLAASVAFDGSDDDVSSICDPLAATVADPMSAAAPSRITPSSPFRYDLHEDITSSCPYIYASVFVVASIEPAV